MDEGISVQEASPLNFTDAAAEKVGQLIEQEGNSALKLRVYISGGGCSGFQYGLTWEAEQRENDTLLEFDGLKVYVDAMSVLYVQDVRIDYVDGLQGSGFKIENPNATGTCGCGSSFSV